MGQGEKIATRESYDRTLTELGKEHGDFFILDADLAGSTKTAVFRKAFPERHTSCGIAEQNMVGVAAGIATTGCVAFASSFAMFMAGKVYEQIRNSVGYPQLNVKIAAVHGGIPAGEDGATHQCSEDFAPIRTVPGMVVMVPSDDVEAEAMMRTVYAHKRPVYMRFSRLAMPVSNNPETYRFGIGKATIMHEGKDVAIIAAGLPVASAMEAAEKLAAEGIEARVIDMHIIKPLNEGAVLHAVKGIGKIVTVEEHSVIGGFGSAVAEVFAEQCPAKLKRVGVYDRYTESGPVEALIHHYGLDGESVYSAVKTFLA